MNNNSEDLIYFNNLSKLHDGKNIFFCKTDFLTNDFEKIRDLENPVILITGNSDYPIDDRRIKQMPSNIKKWYAQNLLVNHPKITPIPLGLENKHISVREGHGVGYFDRASLKETLLSSKHYENNPSKLIYANFNVCTNYWHRRKVKKTCIQSKHIDWEVYNLSLDVFFKRILDYEMVVCPIGNGIDTHRLWEVLYLKRIPIIIKHGNYKIYELYEKLPIIILNSRAELNDYDLISERRNALSSKKYNLEILNSSFWENKILDNLTL